MAKKQLLTVGISAAFHERIAEALRPCEPGWQLGAVATAEEALEAIRTRPIDGVVASVALPGMGPAAFFQVLREEHGSTARVLHTDSPAANSNVREVDAAQAVLPRTATGDSLREIVIRTTRLQRFIGNESIRRVAGGVEKLPSSPKLYWSLVRALDRAETTSAELAAIVETDPAMVVKILQIVNSAAFSRAQRLTSITHAIGMIGVDMLKGLVLGAHVFSTFAEQRLAGFSVEMFQRYSVRVGRLVRRMVSGPDTEHAFTAALLHDLGKLIIAVRKPEELTKISRRIAQTGEASHLVEQEVLGAGHAEIGAYLLEQWGLPTPVIEAVAFHHQPSEAGIDGNNRIIGAVHAADALLDAYTAGEEKDSLDLDFLDKAGLTRELSRWRKLAREESEND